MTNEENNKIAELMRQAKLAKEQAEKAQTMGDAGRATGGVIADAKAVRAAAQTFNRSTAFLRVMGLTIYNVFKPVFTHVLFPIGRAYKKLWDKCAYSTDKETGEKTLKRGRAGAFSMLSLAVASALIPGAIGAPARSAIDGLILEPIHDTALMATTYHKNETIYLSDSKESFPGQDIHSVKGCKSVTCAESDAVYFRVKPSLVHNFWNAVHGGSFFYIPDLVTAPIAPGLNKCEVNSYGVRWRVLQSLQSFPTLLSAKCTPVFSDAASPAAKTAAVRNEVTASQLATVRAAAPAPAPMVVR